MPFFSSLPPPSPNLLIFNIQDVRYLVPQVVRGNQAGGGGGTSFDNSHFRYIIQSYMARTPIIWHFLRLRRRFGVFFNVHTAGWHYPLYGHWRSYTFYLW
jgi:hypothetical protein